MPGDRTLLEQALDHRQDPPDDDADDADEPAGTILDAPGLAARSTTIDGDRVDLEDPETTITFDDEQGLLSGEHGRPRPREFWHAKRIGRTPPMELLKNAVARQLTGGRPKAESEEDLQGPVADLANLAVDIYEGPHFQDKTLDHLQVDAVSDLLDSGFAYWELLESAGGEYPVAGFKPLPPLQIQHNASEDTGMLEDEPAYYHVPHTRSGGRVQVTTSDPTGLDREDVVVMRWPLATTSDRLYGQSLATKVREWLELIVDVDTHQKRHYADSQLPAGFLHFQGAVSDEKLTEVEQDIVEAAGDPHDLVTTTSEEGANWIPVGESVVDLEAIEEQTWYLKLVFAAAGLNLNELGVIEGTGFAKETPALQKAVFKNVTKPALNAIWQPQNTQVLPRIAEGVGISDVPFRLGLERFAPVHEQIERQETFNEWEQKGSSLNELRGGMGREAIEMEVEIFGEEVDLASTPRYIVDQLTKLDQASASDIGEAPLDEGEGGEASAGSVDQGALGEDPVLSLAEVGERFGIEDPHRVARRLQANRKQLDATIEVESSFLVSTAYDERPDPPFMQLEFEREGEPNWYYWYSGVERTTFFNFLQASSKGKYFNRHIRGEYQYARVQ